MIIPSKARNKNLLEFRLNRISKRFEVIDHTADVGLKVYGKDLKELFINAVCGLFGLIIDLEKVGIDIRIQVSLKEDNREELLVSWLNELIFRFSARNFIPKKFKINKITDSMIKAEVLGEKLDLSKHEVLSEIKAATYHDLEIKKTKDGLEAQVIFDT